ncbi:MAG TPA: ABC transporter ATP-binding protein [Pseudonocardiaceae bacterium]|nr:ABC transporter ATP-binding protein [Pseudonocardiaceae bacterium]
MADTTLTRGKTTMPLTSSDVPEPDHDVALDVRGLSVHIPTDHGTVTAADDVTLTVRRNEVLGVVGETGSGKTVTCRAMLGLLPTARSTHEGSVGYPAAGVSEVLGVPPGKLRSLWGRYVAMIPQNPMTSLNPIRRIGAQVAEAVETHSSLPPAARRARVVELMTMVGIPAPEKRLRDYPHQFSGGMLQRTLIAIALAGEPQLLIADEPTTALDVIIQDQILKLLLSLQRDNGLSLVLVSHDLSVVAQVCDRVAVMYAGQIVELAGVDEVLRSPKHPYTAALLNSLPGAVPRQRPLTTIPGSPPHLIDLGSGCRFADRCAFAEPKCTRQPSELADASASGHRVRCVRHQEIDLVAAAAKGELESPALPSSAGVAAVEREVL